MKTNLEEHRKPSLFLTLAAALTTVLLLSCIYAWFGLFPFGTRTLAWGDMKQQVIPLVLEFRDILEGKAGFLFNFQNAGGMSFWGVFFFFLSSPFTFLVSLFKKTDVYFLMNVLVACKLALASGSASLFFRESVPLVRGALHLFLAVSYGLCGYGLLYCQNLVWLDVLCLFPVLLLGFYRLFFQKKCLLFSFVLCALIVVNYYLSFMVLIALVLLSGTFLFFCVPKEERGEVVGKLGAGVFLSLCLTAIVWLPSLLQCLRSARTGQNLITALQDSALFTELFTALPVLFCTAAMAAPAVLPLFPLNQKRKALLTSLLLLTLPVVFDPINRLFHTGSYQAFPVRYGYIPVLLALWLLADCLEEQAESNFTFCDQKSVCMPVAAIFLFASVLSVLLGRFWGISTHYTKTLWFDRPGFLIVLFVFLMAAFLLWLFVRQWRRQRLTKRALGWALLCLCLLQGGYHSAVLIGSAAKAVPARGTAVLSSEGTLHDDGLYRVKQSTKFCDVNLLGAAGFYTLNHYTSLTDEAFLHAVKKLGYSSYWMETSACCGTKISDVLLSNKYVLTENMEFSQTAAGNIGYLVPKGVFPEKLEEGNRFELQNEISERILGKPAFGQCRPISETGVKVWKNGKITTLKKEGEESTLRYRILAGERETLYFDAFHENSNRLRELCYDAFSVEVNGKSIQESYPSQDCNGILFLGTFEHETVDIVIHVKKNVDALRSFGVYRLKERTVEEFASRLAQGDFTTEKSLLSGIVKAGEGDALFLSIPYAPGMRVTVNGKKAQIRTVMDCFLKVPLENGENRIELSCLPEGVIWGGAISLLGGLAGLFLLFRRGRSDRLWSLWEGSAPKLLTVLFVAVLLCFYVVPIVLCCI